jgi:hypothetical protein
MVVLAVLGVPAAVLEAMDGTTTTVMVAMGALMVHPEDMAVPVVMVVPGELEDPATAGIQALTAIPG